MKKTIAIILAVALTGVIAAAAFAAELSKYNGVVNSADTKTQEINFSGILLEGEAPKPLPKKINIGLNEKLFKYIQGAHVRATARDPKNKIRVNVQYEVKDGKNVAKTIIIIPGGC